MKSSWEVSNSNKLRRAAMISMWRPKTEVVIRREKGERQEDPGGREETGERERWRGTDGKKKL
jgi:hypothetical protein